MKKKYYILPFFALIAAATLINPAACSAADGDITSTSGKTINLGTTPNFIFQPSPQVTIAGKTTVSAFSIVAAHDSVIGKTNGEAYGMTSEASGLFAKKTPADSDIAVSAAGALADDFVLPDGTKAAEAAGGTGG